MSIIISKTNNIFLFIIPRNRCDTVYCTVYTVYDTVYFNSLYSLLNI